MIAIIGDTHGHLQLAGCALAQWQEELGVQFEAVFICGDVGTFTDEEQLDSATRRHARKNPCELEFLRQWSTSPQAPWLDYIFKLKPEGGLGLECPMIMVHGNHEGFDALERLTTGEIPSMPVAAEDLPVVDTNGHLRLLPTGWRMKLRAGHVVAGIGGIDPGQRAARYHQMAYINEDAVLAICKGPRVDMLLSHQGPEAVQGAHGSQRLQHILDQGRAPLFWFHGHDIANPKVTRVGRGGGCQVVPLDDIAFSTKAGSGNAPGQEGWAALDLESDPAVLRKETPACLRQLHLHNWIPIQDDLLVCPPLADIAWRLVNLG